VNFFKNETFKTTKTTTKITIDFLITPQPAVRRLPFETLFFRPSKSFLEDIKKMTMMIKRFGEVKAHV
jgi:hypothetical protein